MCAAQETSYGVLRPPLGSVRLTVIELVAVLLRTGSEEAEAAIIASGIVREILAVFLRFPFNSILHHQVAFSPASYCDAEMGSLDTCQCPWCLSETSTTKARIVQELLLTFTSVVRVRQTNGWANGAGDQHNCMHA